MSDVAGQQEKGRGGARVGRSAAIGVSVLAHVLVLAAIGLSVPRMVLPPAPPQTYAVWLTPRLTLERAKPPRPSKARPAPVRPAEARPSPRAPTFRDRTQAPSPLGAPAASAEGPAARGAPPQPDADDGRGVQEALRTSVGCEFDKSVRLTPQERDRCNQRYGETARAASAFTGIEPAKRSRFDAQADRDERRRAGRTGPVQQLTVPCGGPDAVEVEGGGLASGCLPKSSILHIPF